MRSRDRERPRHTGRAAEPRCPPAPFPCLAPAVRRCARRLPHDRHASTHGPERRRAGCHGRAHRAGSRRSRALGSKAVAAGPTPSLLRQERANGHMPSQPRLAATAAMLFSLLSTAADAASKRGRTRQRPKLKQGLPERFWPVMAGLLASMLLPVLIHFVYSIAKDPATPAVARELWKNGQRKLWGALSSLPGQRAHSRRRDAADGEESGDGRSRSGQGRRRAARKAGKRDRRDRAGARRGARRRKPAFSDSSDSDEAAEVLVRRRPSRRWAQASALRSR